MKNGKNPSRNEKMHIVTFRLKPTNWLISKKMADAWLIVHRESGRARTIPAP